MRLHPPIPLPSLFLLRVLLAGVGGLFGIEIITEQPKKGGCGILNSGSQSPDLVNLTLCGKKDFADVMELRI